MRTRLGRAPELVAHLGKWNPIITVALSDDPRPIPAPLLDSTQQVAAEAVKRGIAPTHGREKSRK